MAERVDLAGSQAEEYVFQGRVRDVVGCRGGGRGLVCNK